MGVHNREHNGVVFVINTTEHGSKKWTWSVQVCSEFIELRERPCKSEAQAIGEAEREARFIIDRRAERQGGR